jgi:hypothetical protein
VTRAKDPFSAFVFEFESKSGESCCCFICERSPIRPLSQDIVKCVPLPSLRASNHRQCNNHMWIETWYVQASLLCKLQSPVSLWCAVCKPEQCYESERCSFHTNLNRFPPPYSVAPAYSRRYKIFWSCKQICLQLLKIVWNNKGHAWESSTTKFCSAKGKESKRMEKQNIVSHKTLSCLSIIPSFVMQSMWFFINPMQWLSCWLRLLRPDHDANTTQVCDSLKKLQFVVPSSKCVSHIGHLFVKILWRAEGLFTVVSNYYVIPTRNALSCIHLWHACCWWACHFPTSHWSFHKIVIPAMKFQAPFFEALL